MALAHDWEQRIDQWLQVLGKRIKTPLAAVPTQVALTMDQYTPQQAARLAFKPANPGMGWGSQYEYAWFKAKMKLPKARPNRSIVISFGPSGGDHGESALYVNGIARGGLDNRHFDVDLSALARTGQTLDILIESYAGTYLEDFDQHPQFVPPGKSHFLPFPAKRRTFNGLFLESWNEPAFQLWVDALTLRSLQRALHDESLRQQKLEKALMGLTTQVDLEAEEEVFDADVAAARKSLVPLLTASNGSTAPSMFAVGHSHIDLAWLWPLQHTYRKGIATFSTMLSLMDRYKEYRFLQSQAQIYEWIRRDRPEMFQRIKKAVQRGQWIADGGMWVEADTNIAGGESLIRQFMYGRRYFKETFDVDSVTCWLPDVFGYSANLPQLLAGCGLKYFSTQKIYWNYHGGTTFPYETFTWEGIDGSTVLAHHHRDYNNDTRPQNVIQRWRDCVSKNQTELFLYPFGHGDGGGGPTRRHCEHVRREADLEGVPRMHYASLSEFFAALEEHGRPAERYVGELYFEAHRATYTTQAATKKGNRRSELALREAEMWAGLATATAAAAYPGARLEETWKKLLLNQFHDILPGSSIDRVYAEAEELFQDVIDNADQMAAAARRKLSEKGEGYAIWNSLSWPREALVELPAKGRPVDGAGNPLPCQTVGTGRQRWLLVAAGQIPGVGYKTIKLAEGTPDQATPQVTGHVAGQAIELENAELRVQINRDGQITSLFDKSANRQLVARGQAMNHLELYRDNASECDAWDLDISYKSCPVKLPAAQSIKLISAGPLQAAAEVTHRFGKSTLVQRIVLQAHSRRVEFITSVDWHEKHRVLKAAFPADLSVPALRSEIQFGHVVRPTHRNNDFERHRFEWPAHKWADLSEAHYGIAVLNDCKYGYDILDGVLRLTLLTAKMFPDETADRGRHEFTYALYAHDAGFADADTVRQAMELNVPLTGSPGSGLAGQRSFLELSNPDVVVETVKLSEDGKSLIVRMYESLGASAATTLRVAGSYAKAQECNLIEEPQRELRIGRDGELSLELRPFEIKTLRLTMK